MHTIPLNKVGRGDIELVGGKAAILGELLNSRFPVPPGFVVTTETYRQFNRTLLQPSVEQEILSCFDNLNTERVAIRSSAIAEDSLETSWAGQLETYLNVPRKDMLSRIIDCWESINSSRAKAYIKERKVPTSKLSVAVIVQKMVESEVSGVLFTANPINQSGGEIVIEAGYGLGESVVQGAIIPDSFIVNRDNFQIKFRQVGSQKFMISGVDEIEVPENQRNNQKISDEKIKKLAELGIEIEKYIGNPQDIEWAYSNNKLYILQSRSITTLGNALRYDSQSHDSSILVTEGVGASPGTATGTARVVVNLDELKDVKSRDILVTYKTTPEFVEVFSKVSAVVTASGGITSHAAIVSREMNIPAVVGAANVLSQIKNGDKVTVDGTSGRVYRGEVLLKSSPQMEHFEVPKPTDDEIEDMVNSIANNVNDANELWPLAPGQLMPYIDADQSVDMYEKLKKLFRDDASKEKVAKLFERPSLVKMFLLNTGIVGIKSANIFEKRIGRLEQVEFVTWLLEIAKILNQNDERYIVSRNYFWGNADANKFITSTKWQKTNSVILRELNILSVNLIALNWALFWDYFPETGHELHGPYDSSCFTPDSRLVVKDYFNLRPIEIWEFTSSFPHKDIQLAQIYDTDKIYVNFGNRLVGAGLSNHNTHFALRVDDEIIDHLGDIRQLSETIRTFADKQASHVNNLTPLEKVRAGARISYYARRKFYHHFQDNWYPENMVESTINAIGTKFIDENANVKPMSLHDKRLMWDPRNEILP